MKIKIAGSHLTDILNKKTHKAIRWCTPSLDLRSSQVKNPYLSDTSISFESLGFPSEPSGIFKKIYQHAAEAYGADHTLFSVNGTTGSNFTVLKALSKQIPNLRILAQRNVHKSIVAACEDYGINILFLPPNVDQELQLFLPNTEDEIISGINKTKPHVLLLTNPTYEGITVNLKTIIRHIRENHPDIIVFIEEAWGSHFKFSKKLPFCAMDAGADICVQSTHKQGGALQQGGMIHWKDGRINNALLLSSYRSLMTTSPSFLLFASLDAAREMMQKKGEKKVDYILYIAQELAKRLNAIDGIEVITTEKLKKEHPSVYDRDETKLIVHVGKTGYTGFEIAKLLEKKYNIIVEKYTINTVLLLVPYRATMKDAKATVDAFRLIAKKARKKKTSGSVLHMPTTISKVLELSEVSKLLWDQIERVPLTEAKDRIAAEHITPYPPGIPTTVKGEEFTAEMLEYYAKLREHPNSHILAQDESLETVLVVK